MRRAHGREIGVIECWYTRADKLPESEGEKIDKALIIVQIMPIIKNNNSTEDGGNSKKKKKQFL